MKQKILLLSLSLLLGVIAYGQNITAKGTVVDESNEPAPSVTIRAKSDPTKGVVSGLDGTFSIQVKKGEILVFSYVGYKTQELPAAPQMSVKLKPDSELLDDVVIVGYMPRKITNTSASVVKVGAKQLENRPVANPMDAIQGKVTGLQVYTQSGEPSAQISMALHGQGSLGAGTGLLVIMDGMPVSMGVVRAMNPNDIESVQFLKDAAATSIYGARAANGVMYITTKRGTADQRAQITVRGQYGVSSLANTSYFDKLMTGPELLRYYEETGLYSKTQIEYLKETVFKGTDFQWYKYVYQPASMYSLDTSISGGSGQTNYYISGGALSQDGLRMGSSYKKAFGRVNLNTTLNSYVRAGLNASVSYDRTQLSPFGSTDATGGGMAALNAPFISPYDPETGEELEYIPMLDATTPKHVIGTNPSKSSSVILSANGNLTITPLRNLVIRSLAGIESSYGTSANRTLPSFRKANGVGSSSRAYSSLINFSTTNTASYLMNLGNHNLTALLGQEYIAYKDDGFSASGTGLLDDRLYLLNNVTRNQSVSENNQSYAFLSFFGQLAYDYKERYFADIVLRNDASSRFGSNHRNGLFWSVGLMWKAKKEEILKNVKWLNTLDAKVSYGTQGNSSIPPYSINSYAGKVGQRGGRLSMGFISLGNPDLGWERQSKFTIGARARVFNALEINLEYYNRVTSDMLFETPLSMTTGLSMGGGNNFVTRIENVGRYLNQGIDLQLKADLVQAPDHGVSAYVNFSYNRDKVLELFDGRQTWFEPGSQLGYIVGKPVSFVLPLYKGVNTQTGHPEWYLPGNDITQTIKDDSRIVDEWSSKLEQNTGVPAYTPMTGGWGIEAHWKGFYLQADFSFAIDKHMLSMDKQYYENDYHVRNKDGNFNGSRLLFDYWKKPGDKTEFPSLEYVRNNRQSHYIDSKMLENATFMRMKNLTIGYQVPRKSLGKQKVLTSAKFFFAGRNLLTFTRFRGIDPEINQSVSIGANPNTKQFSLGVELGF